MHFISNENVSKENCNRQSIDWTNITAKIFMASFVYSSNIKKIPVEPSLLSLIVMYVGNDK